MIRHYVSPKGAVIFDHPNYANERVIVWYLRFGICAVGPRGATYEASETAQIGVIAGGLARVASVPVRKPKYRSPGVSPRPLSCPGNLISGIEGPHPPPS
jgi:hypothetical protein